MQSWLAGHDANGVCQHDYDGMLGTLWSRVFVPKNRLACSVQGA
jgi:hypothetical protein